MTHEIKPIKNILLIDDDEDDCLFLSLALATISSSISLSWLREADDLLTAIMCHRPSLIILDYHMPKKSGLDCLKQIKSHPDYKNIPVVIWSSSCIQHQEIVTWIRDGQHFMQKPCSYNELVKEIHAILLQFGCECQQLLFPVQQNKEGYEHIHTSLLDY